MLSATNCIDDHWHTLLETIRPLAQRHFGNHHICDDDYKHFQSQRLCRIFFLPITIFLYNLVILNRFDCFRLNLTKSTSLNFSQRNRGIRYTVYSIQCRWRHCRGWSCRCRSCCSRCWCCRGGCRGSCCWCGRCRGYCDAWVSTLCYYNASRSETLCC